MSDGVVQFEAIAALISGLVTGGVRHVVVAPGSRSTPLAVVAARHEELTVDVVVDERSAAFRALGIARATGRPAAVLCTSGSAVAHLLPAALEAHHAKVPLVLLTADRPPELLDTGAGQTIDQSNVFGSVLRWFAAPGVADASSLSSFAPIGVRAAVLASGPVSGPVQVNVALREPLLPLAAIDLVVPTMIETIRDTPVLADSLVDAVASRLRGVERGVIVAGWGIANPAGVEGLARALGWPLLADVISNVRVGPNVVSTYDALVRDREFAEMHRPEMVLRFGAPLTSKVIGEWFRDVPAQVVVDGDDAWLDPHRSATTHVRADAGALAARLGLVFAGGGFRTPNAPPSKWLAAWRDAERRARRCIDAALDADEVPFDGRIARDTLRLLPDGAQLFVASSMPVRDLEWFGAPRAGVRVHANRGVNGIDGLVSSVAGVAIGSAAPTVALLGDLALLHDSNGLVSLAKRSIDLTFVVVDNDGGGIFSFLPQADALAGDEFEVLFGTPHGVDLAALFALHRIPVATPTTATEVAAAIASAVESGGVRAVLVRTDRAANVARHRAIWDAVASRV
jgi:2-succinyl-5-enolpyruvyl-6-hydroxy-3-cyclohexene-1-carboxylate synthase